VKDRKMVKRNLVFGLTGPNASGKGEVSKYLIKKGYKYYSLSDIVRQETKKLKLKPTRENYIYVGNLLRKKYGPSILAKRIMKRLDKDAAVIDSIRNPYEIKELNKLDNFILIGIRAPRKLRFMRILERNRTGDSKTYKEFIDNEKKENIDNCSTNQQLRLCMKYADVIINNNGSLEELYKKIDKILEKYEKE
jgi:dephospho-CoA kinase